MKRYIGTKIVDARPMSRREYNEYRGWTLPINENGDDQGYLIEYRDGGVGNDSRHQGYISWSPAEVFARAYVCTADIPNRLTREGLIEKIRFHDFVRIPESTTTVCVLTMQNGFTVMGKSACVDKAMFNKQMGEEIAMDDAIEKLWELEGYLLSQRRFEAGL